MFRQYLPSIERRPPFAVALPLLAFVVWNDREEDRPAFAAGSLAFRATEDPDQILMHRAVIGAEPVNQRRDVKLGRLAAERVPAIDVHRLMGGQGVGECFLGHGELR